MGVPVSCGGAWVTTRSTLKPKQNASKLSRSGSWSAPSSWISRAAWSSKNPLDFRSSINTCSSLVMFSWMMEPGRSSASINFSWTSCVRWTASSSKNRSFMTVSTFCSQQ